VKPESENSRKKAQTSQKKISKQMVILEQQFWTGTGDRGHTKLTSLFAFFVPFRGYFLILAFLCGFAALREIFLSRIDHRIFHRKFLRDQFQLIKRIGNPLLIGQHCIVDWLIDMFVVSQTRFDNVGLESLNRS